MKRMVVTTVCIALISSCSAEDIGTIRNNKDENEISTDTLNVEEPVSAQNSFHDQTFKHSVIHRLMYFLT